MALSAKKMTWLLAVVAIASGIAAALLYQRIQRIDAFNTAISRGKTPQTDTQSYQAKFATAYWLARNGRYKEASLLFLQLAEKGDPSQRSAVQYNLGNIFLLRTLTISGGGFEIRDEAEYQLRQAKSAYQQSLKLDNAHWDARHNLDRVLTLLPETPTPGVGESDSPGLIMGNIPVGLP